jgi:hypothetical protein
VSAQANDIKANTITNTTSFFGSLGIKVVIRQM